MAKRTRRRTRSRSKNSRQDSSPSFTTPTTLTASSSGYSSQGWASWQQSTDPQVRNFLNSYHSSQQSATHWQTQWEAWQTRKMPLSNDGSWNPPAQTKHHATSSISSSSSRSSISSWTSGSQGESSSGQRHHPRSIVGHRLRIFGGEEQEGLILCEPMMKVVRGLFDGKLDYTDP